MTDAQRLAALGRANTIRAYRSQLKADLRIGRTPLADALLSDSEYLRTMRVRDLLLATPIIGKLKADRALQACRLRPTICLGKMSHRSRVDLLTWIAVNHPRVALGWKPQGARETRVPRDTGARDD